MGQCLSIFSAQNTQLWGVLTHCSPPDSCTIEARNRLSMRKRSIERLKKFLSRSNSRQDNSRQLGYFFAASLVPRSFSQGEQPRRRVPRRSFLGCCKPAARCPCCTLALRACKEMRVRRGWFSELYFDGI